MVHLRKLETNFLFFEKKNHSFKEEIIIPSYFHNFRKLP